MHHLLSHSAQAHTKQHTSNTRTAPSTQEHKAQHIKEQESTACLIYCHTGASGISSTHAPDQLTTPLVCNKVISDYLCSFAILIVFPLCLILPLKTKGTAFSTPSCDQTIPIYRQTAKMLIFKLSPRCQLT